MSIDLFSKLGFESMNLFKEHETQIQRRKIKNKCTGGEEIMQIKENNQKNCVERQI